MNPQVYHFPKKGSRGFYEVVSVDGIKRCDWKVLKRNLLNLLRGWYEIGPLLIKYWIEFSTGFWIKTRPYHLGIYDALNKMEKLEDFTNKLQIMMEYLDQELSARKELVHHSSLVPWYQYSSKEWYGDEEQRNTFYAFYEGGILDFHHWKMTSLVFLTSLYGLVFYLDVFHKECVA